MIHRFVLLTVTRIFGLTAVIFGLVAELVEIFLLAFAILGDHLLGDLIVGRATVRYDYVHDPLRQALQTGWS